MCALAWEKLCLLNFTVFLCLIITATENNERSNGITTNQDNSETTGVEVGDELVDDVEVDVGVTV